MAVQRALDEAGHAVDLEGGVGGVEPEDVCGDRRVAFHDPILRAGRAEPLPLTVRAGRRSTSSVTSGRAKKRNGHERRAGAGRDVHRAARGR